MSRQKTILFITSCIESWGGSEELWAGAAIRLAESGHRVIAGWSEPVIKRTNHPKWIHLKNSGVEVGGFQIPDYLRVLPDLILRYTPKYAADVYDRRNRILIRKIRALNPDLVVLAQWGSFDSMEWVELPLIVRSAGCSYVVICQKSSEDIWPADHFRKRNVGHFLNADRVYFVSEHNRGLTERMLGQRIPQAEVVRNPFMVATRTPLPWPGTEDGVFRLACVARMYPLDKGQDILLSVLAHPKWQARPLEVSFYGNGDRSEGLQGMADLLGLNKVHFPGFINGIEEVWITHHALILPSRAEGLPLAQVEAMICGRVPIMTPAGGAAEIMKDGVTGFLAASASEQALDEAMERAWQSRYEWKEIGLRASESIWEYFPEDPCANFAEKLCSLITSSEDPRAITNVKS